MDLDLSPAERAWKDKARAFLETWLYPNELELELTGSLPRATKDRLRAAVVEHGPNGINHAQEVGGQGCTQLEQTLINEELGGVGVLPIELVSCITTFSVEQSQACAQQMVQSGAVAVIGGIDVTSNGSIPVLEQNGIPYIGGIPVNFD